MDRSQSGWTESTSRTFLDLADVAVPSRQEQMEVLWSLIPAQPDEPFSAVDICCGEGLLSAGLLERFPRARLLALDGSETMLQRARACLGRFGPRAKVERFNVDRRDWLAALPSPLRCALSSLALHHLDGDGKRRLFRDLREKLEPGGALLIADIVAPASDIVRSAHAAAWHRLARQQSLDISGGLHLYERAVAEGWSYYDVDEPDPAETPSRLFDQLKWLEEAGFSSVDCFWMRAGLAIYGGYR